MSYSVRFVIDTGGSQPVVITERFMEGRFPIILRLADADLSSFNGLLASEVLPRVRRVHTAMKKDPETYQRISPSNGSADYEFCLSFLLNLIIDCQHHPKTTVEVRV